MEKYEKKNTQKIVSNEYDIIKQIGSGSFGEVYLTKLLSTNNYVASKIEEKKNINNRSKLLEEYKIYKKLEQKGVTDEICPKIINYYETPKYNVLVLELLDKNLETLYEENNKKFSINFVLKIGLEMINIIEKLHNVGFIHRDIKPSNFMFGLNKKLYIMDFGLAKRYYKNNKHIEYKTNKSLIGTARYTSINIHLGIEPSRRDDLESILYMLIYFIKGSLPWQGQKKKASQKEYLELIGNIKLSTSLKKLCDKEVPKCIYENLEYVRNLQFDDKPDYNKLKNNIINYAKENKINIE